MPTAHINSTELFHHEVGSGLPCLVLHGGLGLDHTYLHPWLDPLGDLLRLVYFDFRGHGRSARAESESITLAELASDVDGLRAELGFHKIAVMGHSYGGFIALQYALQFPERLTHLILLNTAPAWDYEAEIDANYARKGVTAESMSAAGILPVTDDATFEQRMRYVVPRQLYRFDRELSERLLARTVYRNALRVRGNEILNTYNLEPRLGEIQAPTLIVVGVDDPNTPPSQAERMHRGIRNSALINFQRSGHFPYAEEPDAFFAAVRAWFSRNSILN